MIRSIQLLLRRIWLKYRGFLQVIFLIVALTGYCLVLGKYALDNFEKVALQTKNFSLYRKQAFPSSHKMSPSEPDQDLPTTPVNIPAVEVEMERRRRRVRETCDKYGLGGRGRPNAWEFFIDNKHHLIWCNVFKAASSTWMYNFNILGGYKEYYLKHTNKTPLVLARSHFPRPTVEKLMNSLPNSLSFLIVRDPFERLLSAYRNKIESLRHRFYRKLGREMVERYRKLLQPPPGVTRKPLANSPTFSEFIKYIIESAKSNKAHRFDEHWAPFYLFCTPCHVNFTVIAKMETLDRDQVYIIQKAQLGGILNSYSYRRDQQLVMNKARDGRSTKSLVEIYYSRLTLEQVKSLYNIYEIDFEMFGYDATKYFKMAKKSE